MDFYSSNTEIQTAMRRDLCVKSKQSKKIFGWMNLEIIILKKTIVKN